MPLVVPLVRLLLQSLRRRPATQPASATTILARAAEAAAYASFSAFTSLHAFAAKSSPRSTAQSNRAATSS